MEKNSLILIEFTGKEKESNKVFDTTSEKTAKETGIYSENAVFRPVPVVVGKRDVLEGLDEALLAMKTGEKKTITLEAKKAFGERKKELVVVVPLQQFRQRKINPFPGLVVDLNGNYGKVQTVSGGRVRVDLNPELAGKTVEYEIEIVKEIKGAEEKAKVLTQKFFPLKDLKTEVKLEKDTLKVKFPKEIAKHIAPMAAAYTKSIKEAIPEIKKVEIAEPEKEPKEKK